jgi:hypothetical protein
MRMKNTKIGSYEFPFDYGFDSYPIFILFLFFEVCANYELCDAIVATGSTCTMLLLVSFLTVIRHIFSILMMNGKCRFIAFRYVVL